MMETANVFENALEILNRFGEPNLVSHKFMIGCWKYMV